MRSVVVMGIVAALVAASAAALAGYDKEATEVVLRRAARQVKDHCGRATDGNGKPSGPWGATKVSVTLGRNGRGKGATIPPPFDGTPTGKCAVQAFSGLMYPPYAGEADEVVTWDVEIPKPE